MSPAATATAGPSPVVAVLPRYVSRLLSASLVGRLPTGMAPLAILLTVRAHDGDYRLAGMLTALYAASAALCGPVLGRRIDRTRQRPMLLGCAAPAAAAFGAGNAAGSALCGPLLVPVPAAFADRPDRRGHAPDRPAHAPGRPRALRSPTRSDLYGNGMNS